jgi:tRNA (cytidine/uridine-2'-O-)-methyltransferase
LKGSVKPRGGRSGEPTLHVVLVAPEIHTNTGNIGRLCVAAGAALHLVEPLGFEITSSRLRRAGLDYWELLEWHRWPDWSSFVAAHAARGGRCWFTSGRGRLRHTEVPYARGDALVFGRESSGLPQELLDREAERTVRIAIRPEARSLNVAHAAGIVVFEALRRLEETGVTVGVV